MSYYFPEGSAVYFQSSAGFAGAKTISAVSNANPASCTSSSHGYIDNDEVLFSSGWEDATDTVYRVNQTSTDAFELLGLDSSSTTYYGAGAGVGSTYKLSTWTAVPQVLSISTSGGDARFTSISPLAKRNSIQVATGFNPMSMTLSLGHDPANANWLTMIGISRTLTKCAFKIALGGGGTMYAYGYMTASELPSLNVNQANAVSVVLSILGRAMSYST